MPFRWGVTHGTTNSRRADSTPGTKKKYPSGAMTLGAPMVTVLFCSPPGTTSVVQTWYGTSSHSSFTRTSRSSDRRRSSSDSLTKRTLLGFERGSVSTGDSAGPLTS